MLLRPRGFIWLHKKTAVLHGRYISQLLIEIYVQEVKLISLELEWISICDFSMSVIFFEDLFSWYWI